MIAVLDYGSGNVLSAARAFATTGAEVEITSDLNKAFAAKALIIPGVGAFGACVEQINNIGAAELIENRVQKMLPIFGICVGMQILFSYGLEKGNYKGINLFEGKVEKLSAPVLPHIGWNNVEAADDFEEFEGINKQSFYFVHSYAVKEFSTLQDSNVTSKVAVSEYGDKFVAAISKDLIMATQFHPEKSGPVGLKLISNWWKKL